MPVAYTYHHKCDLWQTNKAKMALMLAEINSKHNSHERRCKIQTTTYIPLCKD